MEDIAKAKLIDRLAELGISITAVPYPAHQTVEEGKALRGEMEGTFTKNLLLQDKRGSLFLVVAYEDRSLDLGALRERVGARGRLSFASSATVQRALGVLPGTLTPFALINDEDHEVTIVIDEELMATRQLNFHPLVHTESAGITPEKLLRFLRSCQEREPVIINMEGSHIE